MIKKRRQDLGIRSEEFDQESGNLDSTSANSSARLFGFLILKLKSRLLFQMHSLFTQRKNSLCRSPSLPTLFGRLLMPLAVAFASPAVRPTFAMMPVPAEMQVGSGQ